MRVLSVLLASVSLLTTVVRVADAEIADGEREFVQQLLDRAMFDLAEQFCSRQLESAADVNERADWELIVSECQQQHAWCMNEDSRSGMITQAAQRITEFLRTDTPVAEKDILLRVRQIELMVAAGLMEETLQAPLSYTKRTTVSGAQPARRVSSGTKFALEAAAQASVLAEALLKQVEEIRRDLDNDIVRAVRERIRTTLTQATFIKSRLGPVSESARLAEQTGVMAEQLQKTVGESALRFQVRLILAEIQLEKNDFATFQLRLGNVISCATDQSEKASIAALKIRALLRQGQPSEALQEYVRASQDGLTLTPELQTLRLQSLLQLLELLFELDPSPQQEQLKAKTSDEFLQLKDKTLALTCGVWRQRCVRIAGRFERVRQVGPEAASELDQAAVLVEAGELPEARQLLRDLLRQIGDSNPELSAAVLLQSGSLAVRMKDWAAALTELRKAKQTYQQRQDSPGAARADLLRVYVVGQQWSSGTDPEISEVSYRTAIEEHLRDFADQSTATQAQQWRVRLLRSSDPLSAAGEVLELVANFMAKSATSPADAGLLSERLDLLCLAGDDLLESLTREDSTLSVSVEAAQQLQKKLMQAFRDAAATVQSEASKDSLRMTILETQLLGLELRDRIPLETDWKMIDSDGRRLLSALVNDREADKSPESLNDPSRGPDNTEATALQAKHIGELAALRDRGIVVCHAMIVLSNVRQLVDHSAFMTSHDFLRALPEDERFRVVRLLLRQFDEGGKATPGDSQLASLLIGLFSQYTASTPAASTPAASVSQRIAELRMLQVLTQAAGSSTPFDRLLNDLLAAKLSESQLMAIAEIVTRVPDSRQPKGASETARLFWQVVQKRTKPGQNTWLEASLQLALSAEASGDVKEASRLLGIVSVLHPQWGTPDRMTRADKLRVRLEAGQR